MEIKRLIISQTSTPCQLLPRSPFGFVAAGLLYAAQVVSAQPLPVTPIGNIFVIAMENHNFTQPATMTSPQQMFGNPALGSPLVSVNERGESVLGPNETRTVTLQFADPTGAPITYNARALDVIPAP